MYDFFARRIIDQAIWQAGGAVRVETDCEFDSIINACLVPNTLVGGEMNVYVCVYTFTAKNKEILHSSV